ncbi:hypothetical protein J40TS1_14650 [Paenibacillus montaniterrae]|uniref:Uncharacterized protein n=1 Tax=Paenibacillus montaniterrae TaxID=429341 RepID=A0A919YL06_9BACL|nr:hypothetical protein [Paenibacillus montaniterrae]GIP15823.1 hypothetical protein J40TS1_14650 [Paenibacillus montaniterrae]
MFTLAEKQHLLKLLKQKKRWGWLNKQKAEEMDAILIEKLEQMIRNELVNQKHL